MPDAKLIERVPLRLVNFLDNPKKQNSIALSTAEVEYVTAGSYCAQLL
jgi:hypothetical protein